MSGKCATGWFSVSHNAQNCINVHYEHQKLHFYTMANLTPQERCDTAMAELDEIMARYGVDLYIDEDGNALMIPAEDEGILVFEPYPAVH